MVCRLGLFLLSVVPLLAVAQAPADLPWKAFTSKAGGFTILMPGEPVEQKQTLNTAAGKVEVVLFTVELTKEGATFAVGYSELPAAAVRPGSEEKRLDNARDGAVERVKGKLKSEKRLPGGYPGRECLISIDEKTEVRTRLFAVKNRLYQLLAVGPKAWLGTEPVGKFFDSFKLSK